MKKLTKLLGIVLIIALVMSMGISSAFAATQSVAYSGTDGDGAKITINNPAKGETYKIFKLFDATVSDDGNISYQGTVPTALANFFEADAQGYIHPKDAIADTKDEDGNILTTKMTDELKAALETWAASATVVAEAESDGKEALEFSGLPYGYYVMTTTHKPDGENAKAAITVTSTQPNASVYDKNANEPSAKKEVGKESYSIGDTITYTATFDTTNYMGEGENAKQVVDYVIEDTLPPYLDQVTVTGITIGGATATVQQFNEDNQIIIPWATKDETASPAKFTSLYDQGAQIVITYTAVLTSTTNINKADKNTISITPEVDNDNGDKTPWDESWEDSAEITTYAAALKKTDGSSALTGAKFRIPGLKATKDADGVYTVTSYNPTTNASTSITKDSDCTDENSTELEVDENGKLYIVGLESGLSLRIFETEAPVGYNKLTEAKTLEPQVLSKQVWKLSGYEKYDADGNLVEYKEESTTDYTQVTQNLSELDAAALEIVNQSGTVLPSTGGIGTTIFYVVGGCMVLAAIVLLITKKRMSREG